MLEQVLKTHTFLPDHHLDFLAEIPVLYHCHHFNLFLEQTVDDALGAARGEALRIAAARDAAYCLLKRLVEAAGAQTPPERLELAREVFAAMGQGRLDVDATATGGKAHGEYLHYGFSWLQKYGHTVRRKQPADAFAAGFAAAATEIAFDLERGSMGVAESACVARKEPRCEFELSAGASPEAHRPCVHKEESVSAVQPTFDGQAEETIAKITAGLRDFLGGVGPDERGLVEAFGVYVTLHLATYYNRLTYDTIKIVLEKAPKSLPILEALFRESGHVCVFNTFGGILLSPEWEGLVGPVTGDPDEIIQGSLAIGRALGFGKWTLQEHDPGKRLVVRTPSTYESTYHRTREETPDRGRCYFLQGATLAIMQLAQRVPWTEHPTLDQDTYHALFRQGVPWTVEEPRCIAKGDAYCEAVVTLETP
jgi:hypothetical protein